VAPEKNREKAKDTKVAAKAARGSIAAATQNPPAEGSSNERNKKTLPAGTRFKLYAQNRSPNIAN